MRIVLIGCSKTKLPYKRDSKRGGRVLPVELYAGQLFRSRVRYAEKIGCKWAVLSAGFGLWPWHVERNPCIAGAEVYDITLSRLSAAELAAWHVDVASQIVNELWEPWHQGESDSPLAPGELEVEIHAGRHYSQPLASILQSVGVTVELPLAGLGIGRQLAWYKTEEENRIAAMLC